VRERAVAPTSTQAPLSMQLHFSGRSISKEVRLHKEGKANKTLLVQQNSILPLWGHPSMVFLTLPGSLLLNLR